MVIHPSLQAQFENLKILRTAVNHMDTAGSRLMLKLQGQADIVIDSLMMSLWEQHYALQDREEAPGTAGSRGLTQSQGDARG